MKHENPEIRARRGARLMDGKRPGWHRRIILDRLFMDSCYQCILGQIYGRYDRGLARVLGGENNGLDDMAVNEIRYGFISLNSEMFDRVHDYRILTATWKAEILKRRERETMNLTPHTVADTIREIQAEREWDDAKLLELLLQVIVEKLDQAPEDKAFDSEAICRTLIDTLDEMDS